MKEHLDHVLNTLNDGVEKEGKVTAETLSHSYSLKAEDLLAIQSEYGIDDDKDYCPSTFGPQGCLPPELQESSAPRDGVVLGSDGRVYAFGGDHIIAWFFRFSPKAV